MGYDKPRNEKGVTRRPTEEEKCTAHSRQNGRQCTNFAMKGRKTCRLHGGKIKRGVYSHRSKTLLQSLYIADFHNILTRLANSYDDEKLLSVQDLIKILAGLTQDMIEQVEYEPHNLKKSRDILTSDDTILNKERKLLPILEYAYRNSRKMYKVYTLSNSISKNMVTEYGIMKNKGYLLNKDDLKFLVMGIIGIIAQLPDDIKTKIGESMTRYMINDKAQQEHYEEMLTETSLLSVRDETALISAQIQHMLKNMGEDIYEASFWAEAKMLCEDSMLRLRLNDNKNFMIQYQKLLNLILKADALSVNADIFNKLVELRRKLSDTEVKSQVAMKNAITAEQAVALVNSVVMAVNENADEKSRKLIVRRLQQLLGDTFSEFANVSLSSQNEENMIESEV